MRSRWLRTASLFLLFANLVSAQEPREEIRLLCSESFAGRGYVDGGLKKASAYIANAFEQAGLEKIGKSYFQDFRMQVNTFPGAMEMVVEGRKLKPGYEFLVRAVSPGIRGEYPLVHVRLQDLATDSAFQQLSAASYTQSILVLDTMTFAGEEIEKRYKKVQFNALKAAGIIIKSKRNLLWTVGREQALYPSFEVLPSAILSTDQKIRLKVKAVLKENFATRNVIGMVKGTANPDSFLFLTAHYDHLGKMGDAVFFPGANDNASGTAMLLSLARYFGKNPLPYTVVFVAFSAEEAGLVGSKYFTEHSPIDLKKIRFLMNLDLHGTGVDGITAVNATVYPADFDAFVKVNADSAYLKQIVPRGKAANSDHHWFTEKGVPCFFIYQMGEYGHYHDPGDDWEKLPLTEFTDTQLLIREFFRRLSAP